MKLTKKNLREYVAQEAKRYARQLKLEARKSQILKEMDNLEMQGFEQEYPIEPEQEDTMSKVQVYDNGGKTLDRYTVIIDNEDVYTMCHNPNSPTGVNQYAGKLNELPGAQMGKRINVIPAEVAEAIMDRLD